MLDNNVKDILDVMSSNYTTIIDKGKLHEDYAGVLEIYSGMFFRANPNFQ